MPKVAFKLGGIDKQVSINEVIDIINNIKWDDYEKNTYSWWFNNDSFRT
jgi:hypothetical protein